MNNQLDEAADMLEAAIAENPSIEKAYLYLGIIYETFRENEKAVSILRQGIPYAKEYLPQFYLNMGNNYFLMENWADAEQSYSKAIESKNGYAQAYLNRANARVQKTDYKSAVSDYGLYLRIEPAAGQRRNIEEVINILTKRLAEEEMRKKEEEKRRIEEEARKKEEERLRLEEEKRFQEEEARRLEEERVRKEEEERQRQEEERKRLEEEERRREQERKRQEALLQEVLKSLNNAGSETTDKSAGSEDIQGFDLNLELE